MVADVRDPPPPHEGHLCEGQIKRLARPRPPQEAPAQGSADPPHADHHVLLDNEPLHGDLEVRNRAMPGLSPRLRFARPLRRREGNVVVDDPLVERRGKALHVPLVPLTQRLQDHAERLVFLGRAEDQGRRIPIDQVLHAPFLPATSPQRHPSTASSPPHSQRAPTGCLRRRSSRS